MEGRGRTIGYDQTNETAKTETVRGALEAVLTSQAEAIGELRTAVNALRGAKPEPVAPGMINHGGVGQPMPMRPIATLIETAHANASDILSLARELAGRL